MTQADAYLWLKAFHLSAAMAFVGGILTVSVFLSSAPEQGPGVLKSVRRWDQIVTTPAMLLVWILGLALAAISHSFTDGWFQAKFGIVLVLSGLHGVQSGRLRKLEGGASSKALRLSPLILVSVAAVVILVVAKPF